MAKKKKQVKLVTEDRVEETAPVEEKKEAQVSFSNDGVKPKKQEVLDRDLGVEIIAFAMVKRLDTTGYDLKQYTILNGKITKEEVLDHNSKGVLLRKANRLIELTTRPKRR